MSGPTSTRATRAIGIATIVGLIWFVAFGLFFEGVLHLSGAALPLAEPVLAAGLVVLGVAILVVGISGRKPRA